MFSEWKPDYDLIRERYSGIEFEEGWRDEIFDSLSPEQRNILVLDDQIGGSKFKYVCGWPFHQRVTP